MNDMSDTKVSISEALNLTADYLKEFGWSGRGGNGWFIEYGQPACLEGAGKAVCERVGLSWHTVVRPPLLDYLTDRFPEHRVSGRVIAFSWNDAKGRSLAEVIEVLRATALIEQARETAHQDAPTPAGVL